MSSIHTIDLDRANAAYASGIKKARSLRERAAAARRIAAALDGVYITRRIDEKLKELFPKAYRAYYRKGYSGDWKYAIIGAVGPQAYNDDWEIPLCARQGKRVDAEYLIASAAADEKRAAELESDLARFYEILGQYNTIATAYKGLRQTLTQFFDDLPYAW